MLPNFNDLNILVAGDVMLDRYWKGSTNRISPESPVPVVKHEQSEDRLGGAANVAMNVRALGANVSLCGTVGTDSAAHTVCTLLQEAKITNRCLACDHLPTISKLRVVSRQQQLLRIDSEETLDADTADQFIEHCINALDNSNILILSDYNKGSLAHPERLINAARDRDIPVLIDPKGNDFGKYQGATLITPNRSELEAIVGTWKSDEELASKTEQLRHSIGVQAILVTLSERGMLLVEAEREALHLPAAAREVFDVTGAGDTVIATISACLGSGQSLSQAAHLANTAAAIAIGKLGTATVNPVELEAALRKISEHQQAVVQEAELIALVKQAKAKNETVVMTNGCFDLLHPGHLAYLNEAASLGDRLIVAVNDDQSVARLKGENRPINSLQDRMKMLAAIKGVDWVVSFNEDTPARIIGELLPDVLVKGGDYQREEIAGYSEVTNAGGIVEILSFLDGYSSTQLIEKIKNLQLN